jgi:hypothetical protein
MRHHPRTAWVLLAAALAAAAGPAAEPAPAGAEHRPLIGRAVVNQGGGAAVPEQAPTNPIVVRRMPTPERFLAGGAPPPAGPTARGGLPAYAAPPPSPQVPVLAAGFDGIPYTGFIPPDPNGAAGPASLLQLVNGGIAIYAKDGTLIAGRSLDGFLNGSRSGTYVFDPRTLYDPHTGRFVVIALDGQASPSSWIRVAVSRSSDPRNLSVGTGAFDDWYGYDIDADLDGGAQVNQAWADFPGLGVDAWNVYVTANMFANDMSTVYPKVWILPKGPLLSGGTATAFEYGAPPAPPLANPLSTFSDFTIMPALDYDGGTERMIATNALSKSAGIGVLTLWTVGNPTGVPTLSSEGIVVPTWNDFSVPLCPQTGTLTSLDTGDTRILQAVLRDGHLWATHTQPNAARSRAEVRWYEIDPAIPALIQSGQVGDASRCYFFPAIHVDVGGGVALVMSGSSSTLHGSAFYTGRRAGDPPGTMQPVATLRAGLTSYVNPDSSQSNRWGDFGGASWDPASGDLWLVHQYAAATPNLWATAWGRFDATPANDACADAAAIGAFPYAATAVTGFANEAAEDATACGCLPNNRSVWYGFTAAADGVLTVDTAGSDFGTVLGLFAGTCSAKRATGCADGSGAVSARLVTSVCAGRPYLIEASADCGSAGGHLAIDARIDAGLLDGDADGVDDCADVCPLQFDPGQEDLDGDGSGDLCDDCLLVYDPSQGDADGDGTGDACEPAALFSAANLSTAGFSATRIDGRDLARFARAFGTCPGDPDYGSGEANLDAIPGLPGACVDLLDFRIFVEQFGAVP